MTSMANRRSRRECGQVLPRVPRIIGEQLVVAEEPNPRPRLENRAVEIHQAVGEGKGQDPASFPHQDVGVGQPEIRFAIRHDDVMRGGRRQHGIVADLAHDESSAMDVGRCNPRGRSMMKQEPRPGSLSTRSEPRCARRIWTLM